MTEKSNKGNSGRIKNSPVVWDEKLLVAEKILFAIPDLVFVTSYNGDVLYVKDSGNDLAFPAAEVIGKNLADFPFSTELIHLFIGKIKECIDSQQNVIYDYKLDISGADSYYEARVIPYEEDKTIIVIRNKTAEEEARLLLLESEKSLKEANRQLLKQRNDYFELSRQYQSANEFLSARNEEIQAIYLKNAYHERILNQILENSPSGVFTYDSEQRITMINAMMVNSLNVSSDEITGQQINAVIDNPGILEAIGKPLTGQTGNYQGWYTSRSGISFYVHIKTFPLLESKDSERIIGGTAIVSNMTEWKIASEKIQDREENLLITLNSIGDGVVVTDGQGMVNMLNPVAQRLTGYSLNDAQQKHIEQVVVLHRSADDERAESIFEQVTVTGNVVHIKQQLVLVSRDGSRYQISITASPIYGKPREMTGVIVVFQDITDNYRMFQRVLLSDIRQKALIQHSPLGVLLINEDGQIMEINNSAVNMLGSPSPEATKRINILNFEPLEKAGFKHDFLNCIQTNSQVEAERKYISKWGKEMYVKYYFNPIILPDTEEKGVLCSIVDVTEQKIAEEREITFTHSLKHLSDTAISFIELSENDDPFHIIGKKLKEFAGLPFILMKRAENSLTYEVVFFSLPDEIEEQFSKSATDLKSFSVSLSDVKKRNISRYFQEVKKDFETYMTEIGGKFTDLYQALSPAQVLAIDFIWESDDFGNATFFLPSHDAMKNIQAIETFINQASLLLQKRETAIRLRQQNDLYMASVNAIADNFFVLDDQLNLVFINNSFKKIVSNFTKGRDIAGLNVFETFPFLGEDIKAAYQKIIDTHKPNAGIFQFDVGPRILFIDSNSVPIVENNKIKYIITTFRDITAQQEYENQIRELKEFNEKIIESIRDGIAVINEQNEIIFTNPAFERILKLGKGSSVGRKWTDMIADIPLDDFAHQSVIDVNNLIRAEMTLKTGRGDLLNALITISPADLSNKTFILLLTDITERKIIESNLLNAKETAEINSAKVTAVIENTSDNIWAFDRDYKIIYINKIFQKEFNETFGVMLEPGVNLLMAVPPPMRLIWKERYDKVLGGERMLFEDIVHTETFDIYIQVSMNPIIKEGLVIGGSCFGSNITPRKLAELELKTAKEKAEESDRLKTAFLSNMSHEIRTPLNSIIGFSYLLYNREVPPDKQKLYLQQINASSQMLLRLIQDIIDISKIEAGQLGIEYSTFDLKLMLQELFQHFSSETAASGKKIAITCSNLDTSLMYHSDFIRIKQVYSNLLSNALKFTESGSIRFGYEAKDDHISFFVKDTGIGIKDEDQAHLFQRFMRIENRLSRDARGTGLGLAICKNIVELLGGSISFESDYQKGTVFTFRLPYKPVDKVRPVKSEPIPKASLTSEVKTLLIAEDDDVNFMFIEEFLSEYGFHIIRAVNGEEVLELLENNPAVDMILMDLQMPVMDGVEATKKIRKKNAGIPIIAQTAYAFSSERKACLDAGCNDYISKPIVQDELLEKIKNCFSK